MRGIQGTPPGIPDNISGRRGYFVLRMYQDGSNNCVNGPMVSVHPCALRHTCECFGGALLVRHTTIRCRPGRCRCSYLLLFGYPDLEHSLCVTIGLHGVLGVSHILPSANRGGGGG